MNRFLLFVLFAFGMSLATTAQELQAMTFNIRYDNPEDPLLWQDRRDEVAKAMYFHDIIGVQEALVNQVEDLADRLPRHDWYGVGRDDGGNAGEFAPVFYNSDKFQLIKGETLWLSSSISQPGSIGWDAHLPRIATVAILMHKESRKTLRVINTHFSHVGEEARINAAWIVRAYSTSASEDHVMVMGDFNVEEEDAVYSILHESPLADSYHSTSMRCRKKLYTYYGFKPDGGVKARIDYIFTDLEKISWSCVDEQVKWGFYISDHIPYFIAFKL